MRELRSRVAATLVAAAAAIPCGATTIVPLADAALTDRARLIVVATVESRSEPQLARPVTDWTIVVERVLKGDLGVGRITLRMPGGRGVDGMELRIDGTPPLTEGQRAILFLQPRGDDTFAVADFPQGAFLAARGARRTLAIRDFSQVRVLSSGRRTGAGEPWRDFDRFANWIEDRGGGTPRPADYRVDPSRSDLKAIGQAFTTFEDAGRALRWFDFDSGGSVPWRIHNTPMPSLGSGGTTEFQRALAVWTNESTTPVRVTYGGSTSATGGLTDFDGQNVILWTDPNQEIAGTFDCSEGGTLAIGGPWYDPDVTGLFNGKTFVRIQGADIVMNDGVQCKATGSPNYSKLIEEVTAHELGHTLGLGHSSEKPGEPNATLRSALMYYRAKDNGKGAVLNSDDIAGLQFLYKKGASGGGGGGGGNTGSTGCPAGTPANTLCLLKGRFRVTGTWTNQFNGTSGTAIPIVNTDLSGFFYFTDKNNVELIVKILDFGTEVKVFYSQLTNLQFRLSVTDSTTGRTKSYANTPGDCGAIDNNFAAALAAVEAEPDGLQSDSQAATASCTATANTLCLLNRRFAVDVTWRNQFNGASGAGRQKTLSNLTGAFSFDSPANLEILIKTLDFGGRVLVIYGSLSNFEYTIRVTDTTTGAFKEYRNAAGQYCGGLDQNAF